MKKVFFLVSLAVVGLVFASHKSEASSCAVGCSAWAHKTGGNANYPDCQLVNKQLVGKTMQYDVSTPSLLPPPFDAPIEVTYQGKIQPNMPAGLPQCPSFIENGNWH